MVLFLPHSPLKDTHKVTIVCHFEEREIFTRRSTKIDYRCGVTCGDFSFLEMTKMRIHHLNEIKTFEPLLL